MAGKSEDAENAHFGLLTLYRFVALHGSMDVRIYLYSVFIFSVRSLDNQKYLKGRIQYNLSFETPLFKGHLHSGDTKFGSWKTPT